MKRFAYACLSLAALLAAPRAGAAQGLTNLNLNSWVTRGGVEKPANWFTTDETIAYLAEEPTGTFNFGTVTKTTDAHGAPYAAKLTTTQVTIQGQTGLLPGILQLGAKTGVLYDPFLELPLGGAPLAGLPTAMQFYYKTTGVAADSALAFTYLSGTANGEPQLLAYGASILPAASSYTLQSVPLTYVASTPSPDSIHVVFLSGNANTITAGTSLYVDDVTFSGVALPTRAGADVQELLTVAPNPSPNGRFVVNSPSRPELASSPLRVLDLAGRTVLQQAAQSSPTGRRELDLSDLSAGLYLLRLDTKQGTIVRPLTIK